MQWIAESLQVRFPPAPLYGFRLCARLHQNENRNSLTRAWWLDSVARHQLKTSTLDSYRKFASYLADDIGTHRVVDVGAEALTQWQSKLLDKYAPYTVLSCRKICRQAFTEAVKFGLIPANPFDLVKAPRAKRVKAGRALSPTDAKALITAGQELRLGAAAVDRFS